MRAVKVLGPKGSRVVSPTMLALLVEHLNGPYPVHVRGGAGRTLRAAHGLGLVDLKAVRRPRVSTITVKGRAVVKIALGVWCGR